MLSEIYKSVPFSELEKNWFWIFLAYLAIWWRAWNQSFLLEDFVLRITVKGFFLSKIFNQKQNNLKAFFHMLRDYWLVFKFLPHTLKKQCLKWLFHMDNHIYWVYIDKYVESISRMNMTLGYTGKKRTTYSFFVVVDFNDLDIFCKIQNQKPIDVFFPQPIPTLSMWWILKRTAV